ncbi:hypothetical protein DUNSADRAFT_16338 [Dunaliella salina]|uniref:Encoded protein n=1 Tax=Dunaliella salina TaxID=3046 RepID=A0ABQ7H111_DUNSA|nr:hypothetical protein DUNSADRAFT_16338 [Dunaliella salina]|eukprot:KAF5840540.1 hypothetical protein DUNSADRAFT_16338 [Dunaliella salina]
MESWAMLQWVGVRSRGHQAVVEGPPLLLLLLLLLSLLLLQLLWGCGRKLPPMLWALRLCARERGRPLVVRLELLLVRCERADGQGSGRAVLRSLHLGAAGQFSGACCFAGSQASQVFTRRSHQTKCMNDVSMLMDMGAAGQFSGACFFAESQDSQVITRRSHQTKCMNDVSMLMGRGAAGQFSGACICAESNHHHHHQSLTSYCLHQMRACWAWAAGLQGCLHEPASVPTAEVLQAVHEDNTSQNA